MTLLSSIWELFSNESIMAKASRSYIKELYELASSDVSYREDVITSANDSATPSEDSVPDAVQQQPSTKPTLLAVSKKIIIYDII
jgi:hypothetical protein